MARQYNTERKTGESLEQQYKRLAKVADQRLVRLEQASQNEHYKQALLWSYSKAMLDIRKWSGTGATRFNTKLEKDGKPLTQAQIQAKINDIKSFIEKPSSTVGGITAAYKKRAESINSGYFDKQGKWHEGYGTSFTWEDMANLYERESTQKAMEKYGSQTYTKAIGVIQKNKNSIIKAIDEANAQIERLSEEGYTTTKSVKEHWKDIKYGKVTISKEDVSIKKVKNGRKAQFDIKPSSTNRVIQDAITKLLKDYNYNINDLLG